MPNLQGKLAPMSEPGNQYFEIQEVYRRMEAIGSRLETLSKELAVVMDRQQRANEDLEKVVDRQEEDSKKLTNIEVASKIGMAKFVGGFAVILGFGTFIVWITSLGDKVMSMFGKK